MNTEFFKSFGILHVNYEFTHYERYQQNNTKSWTKVVSFEYINHTMDFDGSTESDSYGSTDSDSFDMVSDDSLEDEKKSIDEEADWEEKSSAVVKLTKTCPECNLEIKKIRNTEHVKN